MTKTDAHNEYVANANLDNDSYEVIKDIKSIKPAKPTLHSCGNDINRFKKAIRAYHANR